MTGAVAGVTFVALHGVGGALTLALTGVAPWWAVLGLATVWATIARVGWRARRAAPIAVMLAPLLYGGLLVLTLTAGLRWSDWAS